MILPKYSFGVGDRFAQQARAQLAALLKGMHDGISVAPVWNKSNREHEIVGSEPLDVREEADAATDIMGWDAPYFVDADHINRHNVEPFLEPCDFFTIDVAEHIGRSTTKAKMDEFMDSMSDLIGTHELPGVSRKLTITKNDISSAGKKFLAAVLEAKQIYSIIETAKGKDNFITEVSMDESDEPQSPAELLVILAALAAEGVPAQTIAPKFTGRFNKGVDYVGAHRKFQREFADDVAVIELAVEKFDLPDSLKLSVHSGSDKFSIYPLMRDILEERDAGLHLKTAGTTWLEELIGLAAAGSEGLVLAKEIYAEAFPRAEELCGPYEAVLDIDPQNLPDPEEVNEWDSEAFTSALRHDPSCEDYNQDFRQLLHVSYKIAVEVGDRFIDALGEFEDVISQNVTENLYERHILPLFPPNL